MSVSELFFFGDKINNYNVFCNLWILQLPLPLELVLFYAE